MCTSRWPSWAPRPYGFCGSKATPNSNFPIQSAGAVCESGGGRPGLPVPNSPYGLCGRKATLKKSHSFGSAVVNRPVVTCPMVNCPAVTCPKPMLANPPEYAGKRTGLKILLLVSLRDVLLTGTYVTTLHAQCSLQCVGHKLTSSVQQQRQKATGAASKKGNNICRSSLNNTSRCCSSLNNISRCCSRDNNSNSQGQEQY